jgi:hypothetical protein
MKKGDSMIFEQVFVLSLPGSSRRDYIRSHFREIGIDNYAFVDAFSKDSVETQDAYRSNQVVGFPPCFRCGKASCRCKNNILIPQQVANFASYRQLWRTISDLPGLTLIVEDDVKFHRPYKVVCELIGDLVRKNHLRVATDPLLIRMGWGLCADHASEDQPQLIEKVVMANPCHAMNGAYASKLTSLFKSYYTTSDIYIHRDAPLSGEAFTLYPPVASDLSWSTGEVESLIHPRPIRSNYLNASGKSSEAAAHEKLIENHIMRKEYRPLLLSGHPCCGTGYAAAVCRANGLDVGHESDGADGICSWMLAVSQKASWSNDSIASLRDGLSWSGLICVARDPIQAMPSIMVDNIYAPPSYEFRRQAIIDQFGLDLNHLATNFHRAVASYTYWYKILLKQTSLIFRIEGGPSELADCLLRVESADLARVIAGRQLDSDPGPINANKRYKGVVRQKICPDPSEWLSLPEFLRDEFLVTSRSLGYSISLASLFPDAEQRSVAEDADGNVAQPDVPTSNLARRFLAPSGWALSSAKRKPLDATGKILPWFTYSAIEFLHHSVRKPDRVFEYGAGYGTLWWASNAQSVIAVEHDLQWIEEIRASLPGNAKLIHRSAVHSPDQGRDQTSQHFFKRMRRTKWDYTAEKEVNRGLDDCHFLAYAGEIGKHGPPFDIVVIDGMCRRLCAEYAVLHLKQDGMIILDNSNRGDYDADFDILEESGFKQIPFWGLVPGANFHTCTSVFTKSLDRLVDSRHHPSVLRLPEY